MPATLAKQRQVAALRQQVWELYCAGLTYQAIADQTGLSWANVDKYLQAARKSHPAKKLDESEKFIEAHTVMRQAAVLLRAELAEVKARGDDPTRVLGLVSCHSDRMARFLTRQSAVASVEVNQANVFDSSLWSSLLGANAQAPVMADASAVEVLPPTSSPQEVVVTVEIAD